VEYIVIDIIPIIVLVWMHFIADFIFQSDYIAINKSKNNLVLLTHVCLYGIPFFLFGAAFAFANMALHFVTDYITSRVTSYLWKNDKRHWFFVTIGFDQAVHMTCLFSTYLYFCT
jgi:capsule polysaccharide export protein KpsE/RkpR